MFGYVHSGNGLSLFPKIIYHNYHFLQGSLSDPVTVGFIGVIIQKGPESTEVLLNYRHDGNPSF